MKKQNKNILIGTFLIVLLVGILAYSGTIKLPFVVSGTSQCTGGSVLSISDAEITTSSELGGKKVIRVFYNTVPNGECLNIVLNSSSFSQNLKDKLLTNFGFKVDKNLLGDIKLLGERKVVPITIDNTRNYYKIGLQEVILGVNEFCTDSTCQAKIGNNMGTVFASVKDSFAGNCICAYDDNTGLGGIFGSTGNLKWETQVKVGDSSVILTDEQLSDKISSYAFVEWVGNFGGNFYADNPGTNYDAYIPFSDNQFRMVTKSFDILKINRQSARTALINCGDAVNPVCSSELTQARGFNTQFDSATANQLQTFLNNNGGLDKTNSRISSNNLILELTSPIAYPSFVLDIEAEKVGIFITVGEPEATCPPKQTILSGSTKDVIFNVKNIGTNNGAFTYSLSCDKGSQQMIPPPPQSIVAGTSLDVNTKIGLTTEISKETSTCTFSAYDINAPNVKATCSFSYDAEKRTGCTIGVKSCESSNTELWTCTDGTNYNKTSCKYGCEAIQDTFRCRLQNTEICDNNIDDDGNGLIDSNDPVCKGCKWYDISCHFKSIKSWFSNLFSGTFAFLTYLKYFVIAIISIMGIFTIEELLRNFKVLKRNKVMRFTLSIAFSIGLAYLLYLFIGGLIFWGLVIAYIIINVFKDKIRRIIG